MHHSDLQLFSLCLMGLVCFYFAVLAFSRWQYRRQKAAIREQARQRRQQKAVARTKAWEKVADFPAEFHGARELAANHISDLNVAIFLRLAEQHFVQAVENLRICQPILALADINMAGEFLVTVRRQVDHLEHQAETRKFLSNWPEINN